MNIIFSKPACWDIFDHTDAPELFWELQREGKHSQAKRAAIRITLRHPIKMIPVLISGLWYGYSA